MRPILSITFPKGFWISKIFGHPTLGSGGKKTLNGTSKVNKHTDRQTHIWTNQLIESIGPEGRCFENHFTIGKSLHSTPFQNSRGGSLSLTQDQCWDILVCNKLRFCTPVNMRLRKQIIFFLSDPTSFNLYTSSELWCLQQIHSGLCMYKRDNAQYCNGPTFTIHTLEI